MPVPALRSVKNKPTNTSKFSVSSIIVICCFLVFLGFLSLAVLWIDTRFSTSFNPASQRLGAELNDQYGPDVIQVDALQSYRSGMSTRWNNYTRYTPLPNWTVDSQFAIFTNVTIPKTFTFRADLPNLCDGAVDAVVLVETAAKKKPERDKLRNSMPVPSTWRRVFLVGEPVVATSKSRRQTCKVDEACEIDHEAEEKVLEEYKEHGDIVLVDMLDLYQNLTMKTAALVEWATTRCSNAQFVFKVDDDVFPNYPLLERLMQQWRVANETGDLWAGHYMWYKALRDPFPSDNIVTYEEFPGPHYTDYLSGPRYVMSMDAARVLAEMTARVPFVPIEDVYLGICAHMAGLTPTFVDFVDRSLQGKCAEGFVLSGDNVDAVIEEWRKCPA